MPLSIVFGGQYGGEGKGAVTAYLAKKDSVDILIKTGGPNSAHYFGYRSNLTKVRMIPSGSNLGPKYIVFPAGCLIHASTLFKEIRELGFSGKIVIDPNAGIIDQSHIESQKNDDFYNKVGSTKTGTGCASAMRSKRRLGLAKDHAQLKPYLDDASEFVYNSLQNGKSALVEGCQSYGLSNFHGDYPYVTSRDTTVASLIGQIGIGFKFVNCVIQVIKCFPTRNQGGNGILPKEFKLNDISSMDPLIEHGGGSYEGDDIIRRVGLFDFDIVERSIRANTPDRIAITGLDRLKSMQNRPEVKKHYGTPSKFVELVEKRLGLPVALESWGPYLENMIDKRF